MCAICQTHPGGGTCEWNSDPNDPESNSSCEEKPYGCYWGNYECPTGCLGDDCPEDQNLKLASYSLDGDGSASNPRQGTLDEVPATPTLGCYGFMTHRRTAPSTEIATLTL
jgi:hypothetical protein